MAEKGKSKPKRSGIAWDNQETHDESLELAGLVLFTTESRAAAGQALIQSAHRWPDIGHVEDLERPLTNLSQAKRELIQRIATQVIELMPLVIEGEVTSSGDASFHLVVTRTGAHYEIDLEVPEIVGSKGDKGDTGEPGAKGDTGDSGATGATGATGDCSGCPELPTQIIPTPENPPDATDDQTACNISEGIVQLLKEKVLTVHLGIAQGSGITQIIGILLAALAAYLTGGFALPALIEAVAAFIAWVLATDDESMTVVGDSAFWDAMRCAVYCVITPNKDVDETLKTSIESAIRGMTYVSGSFDAPDWISAIADLFHELPLQYIRVGALIGARNAADCSGCDCVTGCDLDNWHVYVDPNYTWGTEVERGSDYIIVDSIHDAAETGYQGIVVYTTGDANICCTVTYEIISGAAGGVTTYKTNCGNAPPLSTGLSNIVTSGAYPFENINSVVVAAGSSFRVKLIFTPFP